MTPVHGMHIHRMERSYRSCQGVISDSVRGKRRRGRGLFSHLLSMDPARILIDLYSERSFGEKVRSTMATQSTKGCKSKMRPRSTDCSHPPQTVMDIVIKLDFKRTS